MSVALSLHTAREEDYDFLVVVAARNWARAGFEPVVLMVAEPGEPRAAILAGELRRHTKDGTRVYVLPSEPGAAVAVAQCARLFACFLPGMPRNAFVRTTDADVLVIDASRFSESPGAINVYGQLGAKEAAAQWPMHSIGMRASRWRSLFAPLLRTVEPGATVAPGRLVGLLREHLRAQFGYTGRPVAHGSPLWSMDQRVAFAAIGRAVLRLPRGARFHLPRVAHSSLEGCYADAHLASFTLQRDFGVLLLLSRVRAHRSWVQRCPGFVWYSDRPDRELNATVVSITASDAYKDVAHRVVEVWRHVHRHHGGYDWYVRLWPDNFVFPERLASLADSLDPRAPVYVGRLAEIPRVTGLAPGLFVGGGASGLVSRQALRAWFALAGECSPPQMHGLIDRLPAPARHMEDVIVSHCLAEAGVSFVCALGFNAQRLGHAEVQMSPAEAAAGRAAAQDLPWRPPAMACLNEPNTRGVITLHYVTVSDMRQLDTAVRDQEIAVGGRVPTEVRRP
eukprot:g1657.t1